MLVVNDAARSAQDVHSPGAEWRQAYELLAAVEPDGSEPVANILADESSPAARALEVVVVTAALTPALADRLVQRARTRRRVSLVFVDAGSFAEPTRTAPEPLLLRLQAIGIPLAVVRRGDDLAERLGPPTREAAAHG